MFVGKEKRRETRDFKERSEPGGDGKKRNAGLGSWHPRTLGH